MGPLQASTPFIVLGFYTDPRGILLSQQAIYPKLVYCLGGLAEKKNDHLSASDFAPSADLLPLKNSENLKPNTSSKYNLQILAKILTS